MPRPPSIVWLVLSATSLFAASQPESPEFFETRIRPILANTCYGCHTASHLGGLRVDSREALLKGGTAGPALVAGDPEKSLLIQAVRQTGELKMPKGGQLKKEEIEDLVAWVKAGAPWPASAAPSVAVAKSGEYVITPQQRAFWSFQPLRAVQAPQPSNADWAKTAIDKFILTRLEKDGLTPVRPADKRTLLRRATLDLTGLPPTAEEFEAFEKDTAPDAFAKAVDKLLASPHYGERWGRLWLDVARFGEDDYRSLDPQGRGHNPYPNAYLYRDWVIQAFNNDLPFDQFVKAQLAADQMDEKIRHKMLPALGFLGQGPWFYDNGAVEVTRADERNDRVDVVTRGFLGLTAACARCHDHKYDPIPTKDYYSLAGVFASTEYHEYPQVPTALVKEFEAAEKKLKDKNKLLGEIMQNESMQLAETLAVQTAKYMQAAWRIAGEPKDELFQVAEQQKLDYELLERWVRFLAKPPKFYPYLEKWQAMIKRGGTAAEAKKLAEEFQTTLLDIMFEKRSLKEENEIIVAKSLTGTKKKEMANKPNEFKTNDDFCPGCGLELKAMPSDRINLWTDVFQRDLTGEDQQQVKVFRSGLLVFRGYGMERQLTGERRDYLKALRDDIDATRKAMPAQFPFIHGVNDVEKPVDLPVSLRGSPYNLGEVQSRHFLSILVDGKPEAFAHGSGRMDLANAIIAQPIALRVWVNRIWKGHFGTGLVDSPSNFGFTGERPTNPDLLEYLAAFFRDHQYSTKALHREILLSAAYQLSTEDSPVNFAKDSGNRLYWRANRHRMDAEEIRDSFLAVAGDLDDKLFGPSKDLAPDYKRRTIYGKVSRYKLDDYLQLFDFPSPNISAEKRFSTNVPQQRLFFMNSDFAQQQGELLARRTAEEPDRAARIQKMYRILFGRAASDAEVAAGIEYVKSEPMKEYEERKAAKEAKDKEKEKSAKDAKEPEKDAKEEAKEDQPPEGMLAGMNPRGDRPGATPPKPMLPVTAWGRYAKILMSSPEFVFVN
jgi:mono/diheme cytochrome c family protein